MKNYNYSSCILRNGFIFTDNIDGKSCQVYEVGGGYVRNLMMSVEKVQAMSNEAFGKMLERYGII